MSEDQNLALLVILLLIQRMLMTFDFLLFTYFAPIKLKNNHATGDKSGRMRSTKISIGYIYKLDVALAKCQRATIQNTNRPRSIYQYSNMDLSLSGQSSIFGGVFFVFKSLLGIERQKKLKKISFLTRKPRSHFRILRYWMWPNTESCLCTSLFCSQVFKTSGPGCSKAG